jgi:hypothetical protein
VSPDELPLMACVALGGAPLVWTLIVKLRRAEFGSDILAGISIVAATLLGEYLAGSLVVLMLSGGEALEGFAVRSASSVLKALANRMPTMAHQKQNGSVLDTPLADIQVGNVLLVFPHEICPVDGTVLEGHGSMDKSYLTGEPYVISKLPGSAVLSGAINGEAVLTIRAGRVEITMSKSYCKVGTIVKLEVHEQRRHIGNRISEPIALAKLNTVDDDDLARSSSRHDVDVFEAQIAVRVTRQTVLSAIVDPRSLADQQCLTENIDSFQHIRTHCICRLRGCLCQVFAQDFRDTFESAVLRDT